MGRRFGASRLVGGIGRGGRGKCRGRGQGPDGQVLRSHRALHGSYADVRGRACCSHINGLGSHLALECGHPDIGRSTCRGTVLNRYGKVPFHGGSSGKLDQIKGTGGGVDAAPVRGISLHCTGQGSLVSRICPGYGNGQGSQFRRRHGGEVAGAEVRQVRKVGRAVGCGIDAYGYGSDSGGSSRKSDVKGSVPVVGRAAHGNSAGSGTGKDDVSRGQGFGRQVVLSYLDRGGIQLVPGARTGLPQLGGRTRTVVANCKDLLTVRTDVDGSVGRMHDGSGAIYCTTRVESPLLRTGRRIHGMKKSTRTVIKGAARRYGITVAGLGRLRKYNSRLARGRI